jgi:tetratricopeptide (TPR) repeat protein
MNKLLTLTILALLTVSTAWGEVFARKTKTVEVNVDSLQWFVQQGDSCMQRFNTLEAQKFYQQAFAMKDTLEVRMKLADCYYKRANYRQTADLLKTIPMKYLSHEAFRQLCYSYQKQGDNDSFVFWTSGLVANYPMDGEMVAGLTLALAKEDQAWKGIDYSEDYFKQDSTNILVNRALGDAYFMDRQFDKAAAMYERLLQLGDSTFNTLYSAGMCYTRIDSLNQAYKCLLLAFLISGMQHSGCAYRLGVVCNDLGNYDEGLGYLDLATKMMQPDTTIMKAITLSQGEGYYLTKQYDKAVEAWKRHLDYNPGSIATYYNIASAYYYFLPDGQQAKSYLEKFIQVARKEEKPTAQLTEMINKAEELLRVTNFGTAGRKRQPRP